MINDILSELTYFKSCSNFCSCSSKLVGFSRNMFCRDFSISSDVPPWTCLNLSTEKPPSVSMNITLFPFRAWEVATRIERLDFPDPPGP